ncbi:hypothetical protein DXG01_003034 [Tephrocybe rancida]|nr:hypothetical protein DXG01_003034 [Tephrocybe rancida]
MNKIRCSGSVGPYYSPLPQQEHKDELAKLKFFTSERICPHVGTCRVVPHEISSWNGHPITEPKARGTSDLLQPFFALLLCLFNVQKLEFTGLGFTSSALEQISLLPNIHDLNINFCHLISPCSPLPVISTQRFHAQCEAQPPKLLKDGPHRWLWILDSDCLSSVTLRPHTAADAFFAVTSPSRRFPLVTSLTIDLSGPMVQQQLPVILRHFLNLTILTVPDSDDLDGFHTPRPNVTVTVTKLQVYDGPYELLCLFATPGIHFEKLTLKDTYHLGCHPDRLLEIFNLHAPSFRDVQVLKASLNHLTHPILRRLCATFGELRTLHLASDASHIIELFTLDVGASRVVSATLSLIFFPLRIS